MNIKIDNFICFKDHVCWAVRSCPSGALTREYNLPPVHDPDKCIGCGNCARRCMNGAIGLTVF